jgi:hypothetical protein
MRWVSQSLICISKVSPDATFTQWRVRGLTNTDGLSFAQGDTSHEYQAIVAVVGAIVIHSEARHIVLVTLKRRRSLSISLGTDNLEEILVSLAYQWSMRLHWKRRQFITTGYVNETNPKQRRPAPKRDWHITWSDDEWPNPASLCLKREVVGGLRYRDSPQRCKLPSITTQWWSKSNGKLELTLSELCTSLSDERVLRRDSLDFFDDENWPTWTIDVCSCTWKGRYIPLERVIEYRFVKHKDYSNLI